ncbi:hypothetical protein P9112_003961 [Eukaryota sp. TZLM1-RC]
MTPLKQFILTQCTTATDFLCIHNDSLSRFYIGYEMMDLLSTPSSLLEQVNAYNLNSFLGDMHYHHDSHLTTIIPSTQPNSRPLLSPFPNSLSFSTNTSVPELSDLQQSLLEVSLHVPLCSFKFKSFETIFINFPRHESVLERICYILRGKLLDFIQLQYKESWLLLSHPDVAFDNNLQKSIISIINDQNQFLFLNSEITYIYQQLSPHTQSIKPIVIGKIDDNDCQKSLMTLVVRELSKLLSNRPNFIPIIAADDSKINQNKAQFITFFDSETVIAQCNDDLIFVNILNRIETLIHNQHYTTVRLSTPLPLNKWLSQAHKKFPESFNRMKFEILNCKSLIVINESLVSLLLPVEGLIPSFKDLLRLPLSICSIINEKSFSICNCFALWILGIIRACDVKLKEELVLKIVQNGGIVNGKGVQIPKVLSLLHRPHNLFN